jgi:peptidylprolyl isomerase
MNNGIMKLFLVPFFILATSCNTPGDNTNSLVVINTTVGDIKIKLYDETPLHRDNFIKLVTSGIYDGVSFHRVIKDFMIQTGDPKTRLNPTVALPEDLNNLTIPAEFNPKFFHKKGALAAARQGNEVNPQMRSSGSQFYIVQGVKYTDDELNQAEQKINSNIKQGVFVRLIRETADSIKTAAQPINDGIIQEIASTKMFNYLAEYQEYKIPEEQRVVYKSSGGTPRLDATYTVFGEVVEGLDVVDKIAAVQTDASDKPLTDVRILKIKIVKK